jgi:hypothetical protein
MFSRRISLFKRIFIGETNSQLEKSFDFKYHNVVYLSIIMQRNAHGQSRVLLFSPKTSKDAETNSRNPGNFYQGCSKLRTGMAKGSRTHRASNAALTGYEERES